MPVDVAVPLIDHHCHGLLPRNVTRREFEKMISESFVDAPAGTSHFDAPFGLVIRAHCALLLDTGFRADDILTPDSVTSLTGVPSRKILRIEAVTESGGRSDVSAGHGGLM